MTLLDPPILDPQAIAADPAINAFVTANAGSGKTKTLIDRVARLLLAGAEPEAILCVTFTKAAAAEMQRRLYQTLGGWSVLEGEPLSRELEKLEGSGAGRDLSKARRLFAKALETPGGLKIQTIHAFCEKLLRRFPLEAGVSPGFTVMDDAASAALAEAARRRTALEAEKGGLLGEAYARFSVALDFQAFQNMFRTFEDRRGAIGAYVERCGGFSAMVADVWDVCGFGEPQDPHTIAADFMARLDRDLWRDVAATLAAGTKTDIKCAEQLGAVANDPDATFDDALVPLFTEKGEGTPATWPTKTSGLKSREDLRGRLLDQQNAMEDARALRRAARVAADTVDVLLLAWTYTKAYEAEKRARGALDFTDLIEHVHQLLTRRTDASWVLFKLDGGVDHILVDEAQDTAPEQWEILRELTGEFFSGAGSPGWRTGTDERTLFVVGDEKQSIYSFQGADPERLLVETRRYIGQIEAVGRTAKGVPLTVSYRSTKQVLSFVDALFEAPEMRAGVPPPSGEDRVIHRPFRIEHAGCVDLWPLEQEIKEDERDAWDTPLDVESAQSANRRLARRIAAEIKALLERGEAVFDKETKAWRPATAGDVLILVRRRKALFEDILRELKHAGLPVAGADRLALSAHIAFDDLLALARFALYPQDELTLAALLKSPFCGLSDDELYALAHARKDNLWRVVRDQAEGPAGFLRWARGEVHRRPFEFFSRALNFSGPDGVSMRARILTRLGAEAADALDEFLAQVLAAEQRGVNDLEALVAAFAALDITVKREMEGARAEVRVMTAHGSKGLEAPIVILPEMALKDASRGSPLLATADGGFLWCASAKNDCEPSAAARERRKTKDQEEGLRLLYVALTRARDRLILCGRIDARTKLENVAGWYGAAEAAFRHPEIAHDVRTLGQGEATFRRYGPDPMTLPRGEAAQKPPVTLPSWALQAAAPERPDIRYAAPSMLGEDETAKAPSPLARVAGLGRYRRGTIIHRLLQLLPDVPSSERPAAARRLLMGERDLTEDQRAEMAAAALTVLDDPRFAEVFGPGSRPEVALAGAASTLPGGLAVSGRVDRLVVLPDRVLVVDFKTNRPAPERIEDAAQAYLVQMAVYAAVLSEVFPGRRIEGALVWTDGPKLMPVPEKVMADALAKLERNG
ncbi:double-strand break repair helicase AddA [Caulobacter sp. NIBR2454]|uniref:double-strand break repair helicase AddA n=1 Tax=Caulobacter sp. NIBR2454 TaxID=3015996 RepID=UPI0022B63F00|nr:double-strand break repair helicase AddA [Caulobacter sp. NIBR2454]